MRPLIREWLIVWNRWALHDMQLQNPTHPDIPGRIVRLRNLRAERECAPPSVLRRVTQWL